MAFALAEQRYKHVRAGHLITARRLHMDRRALHDALEPRGRLRVAWTIGRQARQILVEKFREIGAQLVEVDTAGAQHAGGVGVFGKAEQQMLQRRIFVPAVAGERQGAMQRLFQIA